MTQRTFQVLVVVLLLLAVVKLLLTLSLGPAPIVLDAIGYWKQAGEAAQGDWLLLRSPEDCRTPLYPIFLGLFRRICGPYALATVVVTQHLLLLAVGLLVAGITWRLTENRWCALVASGLSVFSLMWSVWANYLLTEALFIFWLTTTVAALAEYHRQPSYRWSMLFALSLGVTILVRPVPKLLGIPLCLLFLLHATRCVERRLAGRLVLGHALAAAAVLMAICLPWYVRNWMIFGEPFLARLPPVNKWQVCFQGGSAARLPIPDTPAGRRVLELLGERDGDVLDRYCFAVIQRLRQKGLSDREIDALVSTVCREAILQNPLEFAWPAFKRSVNFYRTEADGLPFYHEAGDFSGQQVWSVPRTAGFYEAVLLRTPSHFLRFNEFWLTILVAGNLLMIARQRTRILGLSLAVMFVYFAAVTGIAEIENYRYRSALEPCMFVVVACGWAGIVFPAERSGAVARPSG